jgi:methionine synthase I (cobalamin-dependent)
MADHARRFVAEGMSIVGGCCGVRPEHIRAIGEALKVAKARDSSLGAAPST